MISGVNFAVALLKILTHHQPHRAMNTTSSVRLLGVVFLSLCCLVGCKKETSPPASRSQSASATKNSFQQTTARLDAGGDFYLYLSTEQLLEGLAQKVSSWRELFANLPNLAPAERDNVGKAFAIATRVIKNSGVEEISGLGMSSFAVEQGVYRNKLFVHHYAGKGQGWLWNICGQKPHPLAQLDFLPAGTALACYSDLDLAMLWSAIRTEAAQSGFPQATEFLNGLTARFETMTGLKWEATLASLGKEFGVVLTLDESKKLALPVPQGETVEIPEPALLLIAKTTNDMVYDCIAGELQRNAGNQVVRVDKPDLKMRTLPVPLPLPLQLRPTVATSGGYLFIASSDALVEEALAVKAGKKTGLKAQAEFKRLAQDIPAEGNGFTFVSQRLGQVLIQAQKQMLASAGSNEGLQHALASLLQSQQPGFGYSVSVNTPEGWLEVGNANHGQAKAILMSAAVVPAAVASAMLLPALSKAKERAQRINCSNNLKQLGLAAKIWALDHKDTFPPDLISMKEEMATPKILVCPADTKHVTAASWSSFTPDNCTYEFLAAGASDAEPDRVAFRCPIHSNIGLVDGSVQLVARGRGLIERDGKLYFRP